MQNYDLTVHMDEDGFPILVGTSPKGKLFVEDIRGNIPNECELAISCSVDEFLQTVPRDLTVGMRHVRSGMIQKLCPPPLH